MKPYVLWDGWRVEKLSLLPWLEIVLQGLALAVAVTALVLGVPPREHGLPPGTDGAGWIVLAALGLVWIVRLVDAALRLRLLASAAAAATLLAHGLLLAGLVGSWELVGLQAVFGLFLGSGEILRLIEERLAPPGFGSVSLLLPRRGALSLTAGALAGYLLAVLLSLP